MDICCCRLTFITAAFGQTPHPECVGPPEAHKGGYRKACSPVLFCNCLSSGKMHISVCMLCKKEKEKRITRDWANKVEETLTLPHVMCFSGWRGRGVGGLEVVALWLARLVFTLCRRSNEDCLF